MTSVGLNHLFKWPVSKYTHILKYWELVLQLMNCGGDGSQPIMYDIEEFITRGVEVSLLQLNNHLTLEHLLLLDSFFLSLK